MPWDNTYYGQTHPTPPEPKPAFNWNQPPQQPAYTPPQSNWKPWYEKMGEIDSAAGREAYLKGVFGPPPPNYGNLAAGAAAGYALGWGIKQIWRAMFSRRSTARAALRPPDGSTSELDAAWSAWADQVASAEAETRALLARIESILEESGEWDSPRDRVLDRFGASFEARMPRIWRSLGSRDERSLEALANEHNQESDYLRSLFPELDGG